VKSYLLTLQCLLVEVEVVMRCLKCEKQLGMVVYLVKYGIVETVVVSMVSDNSCAETATVLQQSVEVLARKNGGVVVVCWC
jgi:hypothetical protein